MKMPFKPLEVMVLGTAVVMWSLMPSLLGSAQDSEATSGVILSKLSPPVYPPLARQTMIGGDVTVKVSLRPDGTVESVTPVRWASGVGRSCRKQRQTINVRMCAVRKLRGHSVVHVFV
jgi:hypothetical protein